MTAIHFITGNVGAGKSTYAARLAEAESAHVFAVDEWMRMLFLPDRPDPMPYEWALERTRRINARVHVEAARIAKRGLPVILDLGYFSRQQRDETREAMRLEGFAAEMHYLDVPKEVRWERVARRNAEKGDTFQFEVSRDAFEFCETIFEPPHAFERAGATVIVD